MRKKFNVQIYYSGYCTYNIDAENEEEAIIKARDLPVNKNEIFTNLEDWEDADIAEERFYGKI